MKVDAYDNRIFQMIRDMFAVEDGKAIELVNSQYPDRLLEMARMSDRNTFLSWAERANAHAEGKTTP